MNAETKVKAGSLATAYASAFSEIEAATKSANNPHFKSKYADLGAVIDAVKPALINHGLFFTQRCHPSEDGVSVETVLHHGGGESLSLGTLYVPANKRDAQGFGSALTYARRYGLMVAFGVPAEDDDGNAAVKSAPAPAQRTAREMHTAAHKDDPFPPGPCKNITELKAKGRDYWRDVMACEDGDMLVALRHQQRELEKQIKAGLPSWWNGGTDKHGETFEGLGQVIERMEADFANVRTVIDAG